MRRFVSVLTLLIPAVGSAQPGAMEPLPSGALPQEVSPSSAAPVAPLTDPKVFALARGTHAAASRGDCVGARVLGSQIARLDPEFHRTVIQTDPVITNCRAAPRPVSVAAQELAHEPARQETPGVSGGTLAGEFLVGSLFTLGGAVAGGYLGAHLEGDCSDEFCLGGIIIGGFLGGTIMAAVGVNFVGDSDEVDGSLGLAIGGAMVGGFAGIAAVADGDGGGATLLILIAAPTLGAMLGHNLHRTYKPQPARQPTIDRRMAILPSARIEDGVGFTLTGGTF